ncbi:DUF1543 domain-containing protein [Gammaproteobacteria bacterium]|nr:DUF1543 domain-containing protein [Gammaproteobacteria bacterium]
MKLYMMHVGYYDKNIGDGIYEIHLNYFVAALNPKDAKIKTKSFAEFKEKSMHIDGIKEISFVDGYEVLLKESSETHNGAIIQYDDAKEL